MPVPGKKVKISALWQGQRDATWLPGGATWDFGETKNTIRGLCGVLRRDIFLSKSDNAFSPMRSSINYSMTKLAAPGRRELRQDEPVPQQVDRQ